MNLNAHEARTLRHSGRARRIRPELASIPGMVNRLAWVTRCLHVSHPSLGQSAVSGRGARGLSQQRHDSVSAASGGSGAADAFSSTEINV